MLKWLIPKRRHIVALSIFLPLFLVLLYTAAKNTDPYEEAERFVSSDVRIVSLVGSVKSTNFRFWDGFNFNSAGNGGEANFNFEVTGNRAVSVVEIHLRSSLGVWRVVTVDVRMPDGTTTRVVGFILAPSIAAFG